MAHDVNYRTAPLSDIYKGVSSYLLNDDLSFVNIEFPIDENRPQSSYPSFNVHPEYVKAAIDSGFDVFSLANNHINDFGYKSVLQTIKNMDKFRREDLIIYSGVYGEDDTSFMVETIQIKSMRIGFLSVGQFNNNYWDKKGAAKVYIADYNNPTDVENITEFIRSVSTDFDCLILAYHGGLEYKMNPSDSRMKFFMNLTDAGVDILWGHHPHVLQPWTLFSKDGGDKLIMYSMGNFISGQLAIVDPVNNDINFAATGISSLFRLDLEMIDGQLKILNPKPEMIANIRNENNYFVAVNKTDALEYPMNEDWKNFYKKMFPVAENRIRKNK